MPILLGLALGTAGCANDPPPSAHPVQSGGTLRVLQERANDLDPFMIDDIYEGTVANQVYEGLVKVTPNLAIVPSLAESWVVSEDGLRYRFHLHQGVRFHNGEELSAEVVVASLTRVLRPDKPRECLAESYLRYIAGARDFQKRRAATVRGLVAIDPLTVEIELDTPVSFFMPVLAMDQLRIVPASVSGWNELREHPVGTGPFRFAGKSERGDITLVRNSEYWGRPALLDSLVLVCADDVTKEQRVTMLTAGQVDVAWVDPDHRGVLEDIHGFELTYAPELSVSFFGLNCEIPPLDDERVRRAIAHCVDRRSFTAPDFADVSVASGILPPGMPGYLPEPRVVPYDLDAARALLAAVGYHERRPCPPVDLYVSSSGKLLQWIEEHFQPDLASVGIHLELHGVGWEEIDRRVTSQSAAMFSLAWIADIPDPDGFLFPLFHTGEPNNLSVYSDSRVDHLLEEARRMRSDPLRLEQYRVVEQRVLDQAPLIPLYNEIVLYAWNPRVQGMEFGPYGMSMLPFSRISIGPSGGIGGMAGGTR